MVNVVFTANMADTGGAAPFLNTCEEGLLPQFVPLDQLTRLRLRPPIAGHLRGFARNRSPATIPILGNLWRDHFGVQRA
jgi:8-oxo-dGTP diphosphatase